MNSFPTVFFFYVGLIVPTVMWGAVMPRALAWTAVAPVSFKQSTRLFLSSEKAPRHDVGGDPFSSLSPEQKERVQAYMEHQQNVPKPGFPADVRSLVQYNHGFAVMSTNSKS